MKIIATLKSRDEEKNIRNAIESYHDWVDRILLADGGSEDETIKIAQEYPKVSVRNFTEKYYREDGSWRNHEGRHLNFLFDWAADAGADWIIHDDCDSVPNNRLKRDGRTIIENAATEIICICRLYVYGKDQHFREMAFMKDRWETSLWAWRTGVIKAEDTQRHFTINGMERLSRLSLYPPQYCIRHHFAPDEETIMKKVNDYKIEAPTAVHPKVIYGEPEPLPDWAW